MKKRYPKDHPIHKRHKKVKLAALFLSKLVISLISFTVGLYMGSLTKNAFIALLIAVIFATLFYLVSVLHLADWLDV